LGLGLDLDLRVVLGGGEVVVVEVGAFAGSACESGRGAIIPFDFGGVGSWIRGWETVWRFKVQCWSDDFVARWVDAKFWTDLSSAIPR
jgi:hypothetical protein